MRICQTRGCEAFTGLLPADAGWIEYCPVCAATAAAAQPRLPDEADRHAARALTQMQTGLYAEAEEGFLSAARSTEEQERRAFYLWLSLLCRYGVSYVREVQHETIPAKRTNLFLPVFGRFPLPDTDLRSSEAFLQLQPMLIHAARQAERLDELAILLREIRECLLSRSDRSDVFIAWHDDEDDTTGPCRSFAARLNSQLALSKQCFSFVSFQDLAQHSVDHYEPHIYAALAAARVMVIVIRNYDALGRKFLATEIQRFLRRKKDDNLLRIYFCGMKGHSGEIPAYLKKQGLEIHREDAENSDLCAQLVRNEVLAILKELKQKINPQPGPQPAPAAMGPDSLEKGLIHVDFHLTMENWEEAQKLLSTLQQDHPACGRVYLYLLLAKNRFASENRLPGSGFAFRNEPLWKFAYKYADDALRQQMDALAEKDERIYRERLVAEAKAAAEKAAAQRAAAEEAERLRRERAAAEKAAAERLAAEEAERLRRERSAAAAKAAADRAAAEKAAAERAAAERAAAKSSADDVLYGIVKETNAQNAAARAAAEEAERKRKERDAAYTREAVEKTEQQRKARQEEEARRAAQLAEAQRLGQEMAAIEREAQQQSMYRETPAQAMERLRRERENADEKARAAATAKQEADDKLYRIVKEHIGGSQTGKAPSDAAVEKQRNQQNQQNQQPGKQKTAKQEADDKLYRIVKEHIGGNQSGKAPSDAAVEKQRNQQNQQNQQPGKQKTAKQEADDKLYRIVKEHIGGNQTGKAPSDAAVEKQRNQQNQQNQQPGKQKTAKQEADEQLFRFLREHIANQPAGSNAPIKPVAVKHKLSPASLAANAKTSLDAMNITWKQGLDGLTLLKGTGFTGKHLTIPEGVTAIGDMAFWKFFDMKTLESVTFPATLAAIGNEAFSYCVSLTEVTIPDGVKMIGKAAFAGCTKLQRVTLPAGLKTLPANLFKWCHQLTEVTIPEGVTTIQSGTFESCGTLRIVRIPASVTAMGEGAKEKVFVNTRNVTVITPRGSYAEGYCRKHNIPCRHS